MTNVLDLVDQAALLGEEATGATSVIQSVWTYDHGADVAGLRRFHRHLLRGRLSRRIERSPLPFGRHRWIAPGPGSDLELVETPRPRGEFDTWLREQAAIPLDVREGQGWHLAVLPFTDGGTGISLVVSHTVTDGGGLCLALADATAGRDDDLAWPAARSRTWPRAIIADVGQFVRDLPGIGRAFAAAVWFARAHRSTRAADGDTIEPPSNPDEPVVVPTTTVAIDVDLWDARAKAVGATSNSLLVGLAARLAQRLGRVGADGTIDLTMPVDDRVVGDTRANAITNVDFTIPPPAATTDLRDVRAAVKRALTRHQEEPNARWALLPLTPLLPKPLVRAMVGLGSGSATSVVSSNIGDVDPAVNRPDGTDANTFFVRSLGPGLTEATVRRIGGMLVVLSGRVGRRVFVSVLAHQLGQPNSDESLRATVSAALADFALTQLDAERSSEMSTTA